MKLPESMHGGLRRRPIEEPPKVAMTQITARLSKSVEESEFDPFQFSLSSSRILPFPAHALARSSLNRLRC